MATSIGSLSEVPMTKLNLSFGNPTWFLNFCFHKKTPSTQTTYLTHWATMTIAATRIDARDINDLKEKHHVSVSIVA